MNRRRGGGGGGGESIGRRMNNFVTVEGESRNIQDKIKRRNEIRCSKKKL